MKDWFRALQRREQIVVAGGAALAVVIVLWGVIWVPLANGTAELSASVADKQQLVANVLRAAALAPAGPGRGTPAAPDQSLVVLVDRTHREHGLAGSLGRNQPDGPDGIRVTFQDASFDALVTWLAALESGYGVAVESASVNAGRTPGIVSATLVLRRNV